MLQSGIMRLQTSTRRSPRDLRAEISAALRSFLLLPSILHKKAKKVKKTEKNDKKSIKS